MSRSTYAQVLDPSHTPQSEPLAGHDMIANNAGGFVFAVDKWKRLERFLILGTEGGTYYVNERKLTLENVSAIRECLAEDGLRVVKTIVDISVAGRAPKNDPAIAALGLALKEGDDLTRKAAAGALEQVCRIGTHLFQLADIIEATGGWGRGTRRAFGNWYLNKTDTNLAYQLIKYRQRDGWTHRDILRLAHPKPPVEAEAAAMFRFAVGKYFLEEAAPPMIRGFMLAQESQSPAQSAELISTYELPREAVNTEHLNAPEVWEALLERMPVHAMLRNLGNMSKVGILSPQSAAETKVLETFANEAYLRASRLHPMAVLMAQVTYASGRSLKGSGEWKPCPQVVDALNDAFYSCYGNITPTGKRILVGIDTSGSMHGGKIAGSGLSCAGAATAQALIYLATEPGAEVIGYDTALIPLALSGKQRLDDAMRIVLARKGGGTDAAIPVRYALENQLRFDAFINLTDVETWAGSTHIAVALEAYRHLNNLKTHYVEVAMAPNSYTLSDPEDELSLTVTGFDVSVPQVVNDFIGH